MKTKAATVLSKAVLSIAKHSAGFVCCWFTYQPKVPQKLRAEKQKS